MKKAVFAIAASIAMLGAHAQVGKAASEATDSAQHKMEQKRAEDKAAKSGPVGKAVNNVKGEYHEQRAKSQADNAKKSLDNATR